MFNVLRLPEVGDFEVRQRIIYAETLIEAQS